MMPEQVSDSWRIHGQVSSACLVGGQWLAFVADRVALVARVRTSQEGAWSYPTQLAPRPLGVMESVCSLAPSGPDSVAVLTWQGRVLEARVSAHPSREEGNKACMYHPHRNSADMASTELQALKMKNWLLEIEMSECLN